MSQSSSVAVGVVYACRTKVIGAARWSCFIASAMFAASRLSSRPGFAGVENVQLYPRSETLQKYRLMSCPAEDPREPVRRQDNVTHAPGQARESPAVGDGGAAKRALVGRAGRGSLCARRGKGTACACMAGLVSPWPRRVVQRARTVLTVQHYQQRVGTPPVHLFPHTSGRYYKRADCARSV